MEVLRREGNYERLINTGEKIMSLLSTQLDQSGHAYQISGDPTLFDVVFTETSLIDYRTSQTADTEKNARFNSALRDNGLLKSPGKLYSSLAITEADLKVTKEAISQAVKRL